MFGFFKKSKLKKKQKRDPKRYEAEKAIAEKGDEKKRLSLAKNSKTHQEILYYLAEKDPSPDVRLAVAKNASAPLHISALLAEDTNIDVRMALAGRLVDLLPEISSEKHSQFYAYVVQALGTLALDEVLKIRKALSSALKDHAHTPPKIASQLARDLEREVAEPILRFCAALSDDDLMDIIKQHEDSWQVEAIAARPKVSERLSHAVIETGNEKAGTTLLKNEGANITELLLESIIERAREFPEWHEPVACHKTLSPKMAKVLAEFVDERVRVVLTDRSDFDDETSEEITQIVRRRIAFAEGKTDETPFERAGRLAMQGELNEELLTDALGMRDYDFVKAALANLAKTDLQTIDKVFDMKAPKPICAVSWKAGLTMRTAFKLQQEIGKVPSKELLYPKGGTDYPLSDDDMKFQLEFLGLEAA
ncbi:MAG: DUF2336 domain-containing protein [Pseudomonadota bacterium]